jgi:hypothetical protein
VQSLVDGTLGVERESGVHLRRDLSGDNLQDFLSELNQKAIKCGIDLLVKVASLFLGVFDGNVDELRVLWLLSCREDKGGVCGSVLGLIFANGWSVSVL